MSLASRRSFRTVLRRAKRCSKMADAIRLFGRAFEYACDSRQRLSVYFEKGVYFQRRCHFQKAIDVFTQAKKLFDTLADSSLDVQKIKLRVYLCRAESGLGRLRSMPKNHPLRSARDSPVLDRNPAEVPSMTSRDQTGVLEKLRLSFWNVAAGVGRVASSVRSGFVSGVRWSSRHVLRRKLEPSEVEIRDQRFARLKQVFVDLRASHEISEELPLCRDLVKDRFRIAFACGKACCRDLEEYLCVRFDAADLGLDWIEEVHPLFAGVSAENRASIEFLRAWLFFYHANFDQCIEVCNVLLRNGVEGKDFSMSGVRFLRKLAKKMIHARTEQLVQLYISDIHIPTSNPKADEEEIRHLSMWLTEMFCVVGGVQLLLCNGDTFNHTNHAATNPIAFLKSSEAAMNLCHVLRRFSRQRSVDPSSPMEIFFFEDSAMLGDVFVSHGHLFDTLNGPGKQAGEQITRLYELGVFRVVVDGVTHPLNLTYDVANHLFLGFFVEFATAGFVDAIPLCAESFCHAREDLELPLFVQWISALNGIIDSLREDNGMTLAKKFRLAFACTGDMLYRSLKAGDIPIPPGTRIIVFGHSHGAMVKEFGEGVFYLNCGAIERNTYASVVQDATGRRRAYHGKMEFTAMSVKVCREVGVTVDEG